MKEEQQMDFANVPVVEWLKKVFADTYCLYMKTQNYHWNVIGKNFISLHSLFETQYQELAEALDEIAERIRILGQITPASFEEILTLSSVSSPRGDFAADQMTKDLLTSHEVLSSRIRNAIRSATVAGDDGTVGLLSERLSSHEKIIWIFKNLLR